MDEDEHTRYFQFFDWKDEDGNDTNIYARLQENNKRPLRGMDGKKLGKKKLDKMDKGGQEIEARWFIKKNGESVFYKARVNKVCQGFYRTNLRQSIHTILSQLPDKQQELIKKAIHNDSRKFRQRLESFMEEREVSFLAKESQKEKKRIEELKKMEKDMDAYLADVEKRCKTEED